MDRKEPPPLNRVQPPLPDRLKDREGLPEQQIESHGLPDVHPYLLIRLRYPSVGLPSARTIVAYGKNKEEAVQLHMLCEGETLESIRDAGVYYKVRSIVAVSGITWSDA